MMPTKIIVGACNTTVQAEIDKYFIVKSYKDVIRVAVPIQLALTGMDISEYWDFHAQTADGLILATHRVLKYIDFGTHDELLDRGIMLEEALKNE